VVEIPFLRFRRRFFFVLLLSIARTVFIFFIRFVVSPASLPLPPFGRRLGLSLVVGRGQLDRPVAGPPSFCRCRWRLYVDDCSSSSFSGLRSSSSRCHWVTISTATTTTSTGRWRCRYAGVNFSAASSSSSGHFFFGFWIWMKKRCVCRRPFVKSAVAFVLGR
jgi:hypothetical protein